MRTILVAVDGSDAASRALDFAARQAAERDGVVLHLLYVRPPLRVFGEIEVYVTVERMTELAMNAAAAILEGARNQIIDASTAVELEQLEGDAGETIARRASELACEAIVMGTHGRNRLSSALLGSVAYKVVHLSKVPITLVR